MKKFFFFLVLTVLPLTSFCQISGTKIIGSAQPHPYKTITSAVAHINAVGVSAKVTFLLDDANYSSNETFPIVIMQFSGSSATNTLTIKPNLGKTVTIASTNQFDYTSSLAVIQFKGADNIIIDGSNSIGRASRDLTLLNNDNHIGTSYYPKTTIWIASDGHNGATNITVANTKLQIGYRNGASAVAAGIFSGSDNENLKNKSNGGNSNMTVANNEFINVRQGVIVRAYKGNNDAFKTSGVAITSNIFGSSVDAQKPSSPIIISDVTTINILDNRIIGVLNNNNADPNLNGILVESSSNIAIKRNILSDI